MISPGLFQRFARRHFPALTAGVSVWRRLETMPGRVRKNFLAGNSMGDLCDIHRCNIGG